MSVFSGSGRVYISNCSLSCPSSEHLRSSAAFAILPKANRRLNWHICIIATVQKIVSEILPQNSGIAFGKDARDLLIECCVEFITLISSEANEISEKEAKKTIACEHITKALEQLGFGEYVSDILDVASEHKEALKVFHKSRSSFRRSILIIFQGREKKANKLEQSGMSTEELLALQEAAFKEAASRHTWDFTQLVALHG